MSSSRYLNKNGIIAMLRKSQWLIQISLKLAISPDQPISNQMIFKKEATF